MLSKYSKVFALNASTGAIVWERSAIGEIILLSSR